MQTEEATQVIRKDLRGRYDEQYELVERMNPSCYRRGQRIQHVTEDTRYFRWVNSTLTSDNPKLTLLIHIHHFYPSASARNPYADARGSIQMTEPLNKEVAFVQTLKFMRAREGAPKTKVRCNESIISSRKVFKMPRTSKIWKLKIDTRWKIYTRANAKSL